MTQKSKIFPSVDAAVADIPDGVSIMFGGFGGAGFPNNLIQGLARKGSKNLAVISNNCGTGEGELGILFKNRQIRHVTAAFPGPGATYFQEQFDKKEVELELVPQGILCERLRAQGAGFRVFFAGGGWHRNRQWQRRARDSRAALYFGAGHWRGLCIHQGVSSRTSSVIWFFAKGRATSIR